MKHTKKKNRYANLKWIGFGMLLCFITLFVDKHMIQIPDKIEIAISAMAFLMMIGGMLALLREKKKEESEMPNDVYEK
jgi:hypothetical protein